MSDETEITLTFWCERYPNQFKVTSFGGTEGISIPYRFEIVLGVADPDIDFDAVVGKEARLTIAGPPVPGRMAGPRHIRGTIADIAFVGSKQAADQGEIQLAQYQVLLVPPMAQLSLRRNLRIFQGQTTKEIVTAIFAEHGLNTAKHTLDFARNITRKYKARNYCVQYRESDFDFVSRLLEEEGIAYHYEHEETKQTLVFTDFHEQFSDIQTPRILYKPGGMVAGDDVIYGLSLRQRMQTERVELRDYRFKDPRVPVDRAGDGPKTREAYDYPSEFADPNDDVGDVTLDNQIEGKLAAIRMEELTATTVTGSAKSNCSRLVPGYTFTLYGHQRSQIDEKSYLLLTVTHTGTQPGKSSGDKGTYENEFTFMPAVLPYRPPHLTHKPVVHGAHTAVVVGPPDETIHIDKYSRVKVCFHWDREHWDKGRPDDSSCYVRVSQGWAGQGFGAMFFPRIGQEVLVTFIEGDPDQPLVTGRVYNGDHQNGDQRVPDMIGGEYADYKGGTRRDPAAAGVTENMTRSTIRTDSVDGEGYNELRFEDDAKKGQQVYLRAQRDLDIEVMQNQTVLVKKDRLGHTNRDQKQWIDRDQLVIVGSEAETNAGKRLLLKVGSSAIELTPSEIVIYANKITTKCSGGGRIVFDGPNVNLNCAAGAGTSLPQPSILSRSKGRS